MSRFYLISAVLNKKYFVKAHNLAFYKPNKMHRLASASFYFLHIQMRKLLRLRLRDKRIDHRTKPLADHNLVKVIER